MKKIIDFLVTVIMILLIALVLFYLVLALTK